MPDGDHAQDEVRKFLKLHAVRCPRCSYDLCGAGGDRCPECGLRLTVALLQDWCDVDRGGHRASTHNPPAASTDESAGPGVGASAAMLLVTLVAATAVAVERGDIVSGWMSAGPVVSVVIIVLPAALAAWAVACLFRLAIGKGFGKTADRCITAVNAIASVFILWAVVAALFMTDGI